MWGARSEQAQDPSAALGRIASRSSDDIWGICFRGDWCGNRWLPSKHVLLNMPSILLFQSRELHHKASGGNSTRDAIERQFPAGVLPGSFSHMPGDWHRKGNLIYVSFDWKSFFFAVPFILQFRVLRRQIVKRAGFSVFAEGTGLDHRMPCGMIQRALP